MAALIFTEFHKPQKCTSWAVAFRNSHVWLKGPAFGHGSLVCMGCLLGAVCMGTSGSPAPELGSPVRKASSMARSHHESWEGDKALAAILMSFPLALLLQAYLALFFFFSPYLSSWDCWEHLCKIQHGWENTVPRSSTTLPAFHVLHFAFAVTTIRVLLSPANKGRLCSAGSVPERCAFLC